MPRSPAAHPAGVAIAEQHTHMHLQAPEPSPRVPPNALCRTPTIERIRAAREQRGQRLGPLTILIISELSSVRSGCCSYHLRPSSGARAHNDHTHASARAALVHAATATHAAARQLTADSRQLQERPGSVHSSRASQPSASQAYAHAGTCLCPHLVRARSSTRHHTCEERLLHSVRSARRRPGSARTYCSHVIRNLRYMMNVISLSISDNISIFGFHYTCVTHISKTHALTCVTHCVIDNTCKHV